MNRRGFIAGLFALPFAKMLPLPAVKMASAVKIKPLSGLPSAFVNLFQDPSRKRIDVDRPFGPLQPVDMRWMEEAIKRTEWQYRYYRDGSIPESLK